MKEFRGYKSVENSYRQKFITDMLGVCPEYQVAKYAVFEKIDGANFQIRADSGSQKVLYGRRKASIDPDEKFYNYKTIVLQPLIKEIEEYILTLVANGREHVILFGELYGPSIQGRIDYGGAGIRFFDMVIDGKYLTQKEMKEIFVQQDLESMLAPALCGGALWNLKDALKLDPENIHTALNPEESERTLIEGFVIKPWDKICLGNSGEQKLFYIKHKTKKFADVMSVKHKTRVEIPEAVSRVIATYESYLTPNRVLDVMGKHGQIETPTQIGKYIKLVVADAKEDFLKDHVDSFNELDQKWKSRVFSGSGRLLVPILNESL